MAAFFGHGNPLTTPIGQLIEQATDGSQATENWALYMEVCDLINETDEGPKDAIRAFRKKISQTVGKNYTTVIYCLTCIESCVKNCGRRFHIQVVNKDFLHDLIKIIGPKNDPPQIVQEKVLSMIQTWADAFRGNQELKEIEKVYQELKQKGIEFPMTDLDNLAPIHTPARTVPEQGQPPVPERGGSSRGPPAGFPPAAFPPGGYPPSSYPAQPPPPVNGGGSGGSGGLSSEQTAKLRRELEVVQGNIRVMSEMLTELSPTSVDPSDLELLQELNRTCRQMQSRIVELLNEIATEEITSDLLHINDDLNNVFLRYERFERYRTGQSGQTSTATSTASTPSAEPASQDSVPPPSYDQLSEASNPKVGNLIDFGDSPTPAPPSSQLAGLSLNPTTTVPTPPAQAVGSQSGKDDDFDMFAQSRQSFDQNKQTLSGTNYTSSGDSYNMGLAQAVSQKTTPQKTLNLQEKDSDYDEMEQWLATHGGLKTDGETQQPITSSEFDRFLSERVSASQTLPTIPAQTGQQPAVRTTRTLNKDEDENPLFAL